MTTQTFRKKPVEIEAMQWDGTTAGATPIIDWILGSGGTASYVCADPNRCAENDGDSPHRIVIRTLEGDMTASVADWIIRVLAGQHEGRDGAFRASYYPCKPDIFEATYEPVKP